MPPAHPLAGPVLDEEADTLVLDDTGPLDATDALLDASDVLDATDVLEARDALLDARDVLDGSDALDEECAPEEAMTDVLDTTPPLDEEDDPRATHALSRHSRPAPQSSGE